MIAKTQGSGATHGTPHQIADWLAGHGIAVHPLIPGRKLPVGQCERCRPPRADRPNPLYIPHEIDDCRCITAGRPCHGVRAATTDVTRVEQWWTQDPRCGVGVACGPSGIVIIDIDAHGGTPPADPLPGVEHGTDATSWTSGWDTLDALCAARGTRRPWEVEPTLTVATPSGGLHAWYRVEDPWRWTSGAGRIGWQIDLRASWGYGIAPGTWTPQGAYEAVGTCRTIAPLPAWLAEDLRRVGHYREPVRAIPSNRRTLPTPQRTGARYVDAIIRAEVDAVASCSAGTRNQRLWEAARALGRFITTGQLAPSDIERELTAAASACGLRAGEAAASIASGLRHGMRRAA